MNIDQELLIAEALRDRQVFDEGVRRLKKQVDVISFVNRNYQKFTAEAEAVDNLRKFIATLDALYEFAKETKGTP